MRLLFDAFDERAAFGETPSSVTVTWDDYSYTLSAADYLAYREGETSFLETVARVRIERTTLWSPRVLWRRYWWALVTGGLLLLFAFMTIILMRRRRKARVTRSTTRATASTGLPAFSAPQPLPNVLCLYPLVGSPHPLHAECTTIGSQEGNHIWLSARGVAPHHARIWRTREGTWFIEDLGSQFRTLVDGQVVPRQWIQAGSAISIGEWQARVDWSHPQVQQPMAGSTARHSW
jgi:hypothetical protein